LVEEERSKSKAITEYLRKKLSETEDELAEAKVERDNFKEELQRLKNTLRAALRQTSV
jgi:chromosome segregation ATPase